MRRTCFCLAALCLMLAGCGSKEAQVTPAPSPSVTAAPTATPSPTPELTASPEPTATPAPWETDPKGYLLDRLDQTMERSEVFVRFWFHPGSGPTPENLPTAEYAESVRAVFAELDWEKVEEPAYFTDEEAENPYDQPGAYSVNIYLERGTASSIGLGKGNPVIGLYTVESEVKEAVYLRAEGADKLCDALADLMPDPYYNLGRVRVPWQGSKEETLKRYLETALERTKELGHITDYELRAYEVTSPENENGEDEEAAPLSMAYTATYAFKPAHPESAFWKGYDLESTDGWSVASIEDYTEFLDYDERDGCYGMG